MAKAERITDEDLPYIARRICIGFIVSTEFLQRILPVWKPELLEADLSRIICGWCLDYFQQYAKAPGADIVPIYNEKKIGLDPDMAEQAEILLESLTDEYEREVFNVEYLLDQTKRYLHAQHLNRHLDEVNARRERGEVTEAEAEIYSYAPPYADDTTYVDPFGASAAPALRAAFSTRKAPLVLYPSALGAFWNEELVRDSFVAFLAAEKTGKSWLLLDVAMRAARQGCNTVMFQAGDMTQNQQLRRLAIYCARRSDQERYCKDRMEPVLECMRHQTDRCDKPQREPSHYSEPVVDAGGEPSYDALLMAAERFKKHSPCHNCNQIQGAVWLKKMADCDPLTSRDVVHEVEKFRKVVKGRLRISTHANETLTVTGMKALLSSWERQDGFVADVIVIDYADILAPCPDFARLDFRHQQNKIWQRMRNLSQERHCLVVTATQAKAAAYGKELLGMEDFSEDKRKLAHVTAMFGLNQTAEEKRIGIMRINPLIIRESDYATDRPVHVMQRLQMGRPVLGSYVGAWRERRTESK
jgi:hypothetical protein